MCKHSSKERLKAVQKRFSSVRTLAEMDCTQVLFLDSRQNYLIFLLWLWSFRFSVSYVIFI